MELELFYSRVCNCRNREEEYSLQAAFLEGIWCRQHHDPMPGALVGRMRELVEYKVISEASSWVKSPNPHKKPFRFNNNLDLSATNDQFSTMHYSQENNTVVLELRLSQNG